MKQGKLAVISGPSGAGKDTLVNIFLSKHPDWINPPSQTTRSPRVGEIDGKDYSFVDLKSFQTWQQQGKFLESFQVYKGTWYGTLVKPVEDLRKSGKHVLLRVDVHGALDIKQKVPDAITVIIKPESLEILQERISKRGSETAQTMAERLEVAKKEISLSDRFDHAIVNSTGKQEEALRRLETILTGL